MPPITFDSGHLFDAGLKYDAAAPGPGPGVPTTKRTNRSMNPFKLELNRKTPEEKVAMGAGHKVAMTDNDFYPVPNRLPPDAELDTAQADLVASLAHKSNLETQLAQAEEDILAKVEIWDAAYTARANFCAAAQPDNPTAWASTALPMKSEPSPIGDLPAPDSLRARKSEKDGEIIVSWRSVYGSKMYKLQMMVHGTGNWVDVVMQPQVRFTVKGLTSGSQYAFRVLAMGPRGESPWSDEAVCRAP